MRTARQRDGALGDFAMHAARVAYPEPALTEAEALAFPEVDPVQARFEAADHRRARREVRS